MAKILSRADKKKKLLEDLKKDLVRKVQKFCTVDEKEKRISITHPQYNDLKKDDREMIADLKIKFGFYIQWEIFEIPAGGG